jgi:ubiquinone/menaquinone biosynthesis C-methylase UbiE
MFSENPFDELAQHYDALFTFSQTGNAQRDIVRRFLKSRIVPGSDVLEINCGTGEDAYYLSSLGCSVIATDASKGMIHTAEGKRENISNDCNPVFIQVSIQDLDIALGTKKFDLIFSNFSGLNCLTDTELIESAHRFHSLLKSDGRLIFILFGTNCFWEKLYFFLKQKKGEIHRRSRNESMDVQILNSKVPVFYYKPAVLRDLYSTFFKLEMLRPVGLFLPPTYLEAYFHRKRVLFKILKNTDKLFQSFSLLSNHADHYLAEFSRI